MNITANRPQSSQVALKIFPQDPMVSTPEEVLLPREQMGDRLDGTRLETRDSVAVAQADSQGNYFPEFNTAQFDQVNTHGTVASALLTYERCTGHSIPWSFKGPMEVNPHAGEGKTAYYSRWGQSINFCQWDSPSLGKVVKTSEAFDVASHEAGHAILDGLRPGLLAGKESKAFHEAFGDCSALLHALQFDSNLEKILAENGGDFSRPSLISRLAEEFGTAFNKEDDNPNNDDHPYYRTALNDFKYQPINTLPSDSYPPSQPEEVLTSEPHSFGRIWSGAFYSVLGSLYQQAAATAETPMAALKTARGALEKLWGHSLDQLPASNLKFPQAARGMLREARNLEDGRYFDAVARVMIDRQLLTPQEVESLKQAEVGSINRSQLSSPAQLSQVLGLDPQLQWQADPVQVGSQGREVLTFRAPHSVSLDLGPLGPARTELHSGLTLVFDAEGQLLHQTYSPVTAEDQESIRQEAAEVIRQGRLALPGLAAAGPVHQARLVVHREGPPSLEWIPVWE